MKVIKSGKVNRMIDRFDNELKALLMNDLKAIKAITHAKSAILNSIQQTTSLSIA
jgi:hypothetical protein